MTTTPATRHAAISDAESLIRSLDPAALTVASAADVILLADFARYLYRHGDGPELVDARGLGTWLAAIRMGEVGKVRPAEAEAEADVRDHPHGPAVVALIRAVGGYVDTLNPRGNLTADGFHHGDSPFDPPRVFKPYGSVPSTHAKSQRR